MHRGTERIWMKCEKYTVKIKCLATLQLVGQSQAAVHFKQNSSHCACGSIFLIWNYTVSSHLSSSKAGLVGYAESGLADSDLIIITLSREIKPMGKFITEVPEIRWKPSLSLCLPWQQSSSTIKGPVSHFMAIWNWGSFIYIHVE